MQILIVPKDATRKIIRVDAGKVLLVSAFFLFVCFISVFKTVSDLKQQKEFYEREVWKEVDSLRTEVLLVQRQRMKLESLVVYVLGLNKPELEGGDEYVWNFVDRDDSRRGGLLSNGRRAMGGPRPGKALLVPAKACESGETCGSWTRHIQISRYSYIQRRGLLEGLYNRRR